MKRLLIGGACVFAMGMSAAFAADAVSQQQKPMTPEERAAYRAEAAKRIYEKTGGRLRDTRQMKGTIWFVNAQKRADAAWIRAAVAANEDRYFYDFRFADGDFDVRKPVVRGEVTLFVIDDAALPMSLVALEAGWGAVNVAPLASGRGEKPAFLEARVKKEVSRTFAILAGAASSSYDGNILGPVRTPDDLDRYPNNLLPFDAVGKAAKYLQPYGVAPFSMSYYIKACHEGWAPAPTNDVQKAVWEKAKADKERGPANAIKIAPPKK